MDVLSGKPQSWLSWFLRGILIVAFLILFSKLVEVQIIKGSYYRALAEENRIRHIPIPAPRGKIIARGGETLAGNIEVKRRVKFLSQGGFEITDDLTGAGEDEIITDFRRYYSLGAKFAHGSGYLGEVSPDEVGKIDPLCQIKGPRILGALAGQTGLEAQYECFLSGTPGEELVEVDTSGKKIRTLGKREPVAGRDLKTTIDYKLQTETANAMEDKKGAVIVSDTLGEILAFYSAPSFDPNKIGEGLFTDPDLPFFNRVIGGTFHPGSVFKPLVAISALEEGKIDENFRFNDTGVITVKTLYGDFSYTNWYFTQYGGREGEIYLIRAIARSTDTFFYTVGEMVGPESIAKWAGKLGLNKESGIDLPGEVKGLIPTPEWKEKVKKEKWFLGNTYHMSIGQGDVAVSPIEINTYISAIASGNLCKPHFTGDANCEDLKLQKENLNLVRDGMREVCSTGGTGYTFFDFSQKHNGIEVACKTGTAESSTDDEEPHAWFTLFAPVGDNLTPQVVATVLVERGGEGSKVAGPIARKILDKWVLETNP